MSQSHACMCLLPITNVKAIDIEILDWKNHGFSSVQCLWG
jgi:hypothetical protein